MTEFFEVQSMTDQSLAGTNKQTKKKPNFVLIDCRNLIFAPS